MREMFGVIIFPNFNYLTFFEIVKSQKNVI